MAIRVELDMEAFAKELSGLPARLEGSIILGLRSAAARGVTEIVEQINTAKPYPAVDRGQLASSVEYTSLQKGGRISVDAPHAGPMETGTRPFWPPLQPLIDWAQRKFGVDEDEAGGIARSVQLKIATFGIEPRHYLRKAMVNIRKHVVIEVESELAKMSRAHARKPRRKGRRRRR